MKAHSILETWSGGVTVTADQEFSTNVQRTLAFLATHGVVHYPELMTFLKVSRKKVSAYLDAVSAQLAQQNIKVVRKRNVGIYLEGDLKQLNSQLDKDTQYLSLDVTARQNLITLNLLMSDTPVTLDQLANQFFISRSTLDRDIKAIKQNLPATLQLVGTADGVAITGGERQKRDTASKIIARYWQESVTSDQRVVSLPTGFTELISPAELNTVQRILAELQQRTDLAFTEYQYQSLLIHICISTVRIKDSEYLAAVDSNLAKSILPETKLLTQLIEAAFALTVPVTEQAYLNIHILAAKQSQLSPAYFQHTSVISNQLKTLTGFLTANIIEADQQLINDLAVHLEPAIHRFQAGLQAGNPYTAEITKLYPQAFELAFELSQDINREFAVNVDKNEIAYLALHFEAYLERRQQVKAKSQRVTMAVVCSTGMGTARLLTQRIQAAFGDTVQITKVLSVPELFQHKLDEDLIVSTIPVEAPQQHVIVVQPFFSKTEQALLQSEIAKLQFAKRLTSSRFMNFVSPEFVLVANEALTQEQALQQMTDCLIQGCVAKNGALASALHREAIASTLLEDQWAAVPHAESEYLLRSQITILIAPQGIKWGNGTARVAFFMSFTPAEAKHISLDVVYHDFNQLLSDETAMTQLIAQPDADSVIRDLTKFFARPERSQ